MSVAIRCERNYGKSDLKKIIESCGCCPPMEPQCPPIRTACPPEPSIICCSPCPQQQSNCPPPTPIICATCPPQPCTLPCSPRPPCLGYPCVTFAALPKPVPAPFEFGPVLRTRITTGGLYYTGTIRELCDLCPRSHVDRSNCTITTCIWPLLNIERHKTCQAYCPKGQPIKAVNFRQPVNSPRGYGPWTNLTYHPIIQGGFRYFGVQKLVPLGPPPSSPVLSRFTSVRPTDPPDLVVYSAPHL